MRDVLICLFCGHTMVEPDQVISVWVPSDLIATRDEHAPHCPLYAALHGLLEDLHGPHGEVKR